MPKAIPTVTAEQLAHLVGARLKARRLALHWTVSDVQAKGGPTYHTVQKIEAGAQAGIDVLERHITALGLTLREVFTAALTPPGREQRVFSRDASEVARVYDQATPEGQAALLSMARALDQPGRRRRLALQHSAAARSTQSPEDEESDDAQVSATGTG